MLLSPSQLALDCRRMSMKNHAVIPLLLGLFSLLITACGSGISGEESTRNSIAKSQACLASGCHATSISRVSGALITGEWNSSIHYRMNVAGCADCHTLLASHLCSECHGGSIAGKSSAHSKPCYICHDGANTMKPLDGKHLSAVPQTYSPTVSLDHYHSAGYAVLRGTPFESDCRWCHNPHANTVTEQHREWSESGHGEVNAEPYVYYDFKVRGTDSASPRTSAPSDCVRCHTSTGYLNYINSGFNDVHAWGAKRNPDGTLVGAGNVPISNQKQVIYCNVCHDDGNGNAYGFRMREVPQVTGYYNFKVAATIPANPSLIINSFLFPDVATSNICLPCHAGREAGSTVRKVFEAITSAKQYNNIGFINSHYLTAGGTIFKATGYEFVTQYGRSYNSASDQFRHDQIGRNNASGSGIDGPCVTCHLRPRRHTFLPVLRGDYVAASPLVDQFGAIYKNPLNQSIAALESPVCNSVCHSWTATDLEKKKDGYRHALKIFQTIVETSSNFTGRVPQYIASTSPYFFNQSSAGTKPQNYSKTSVAGNNTFKKWGNEGNMGAAFNLNLLFRDYGGFAHNDLYAKRLIFDSIDWLDSGAAFSAGTTINNLDPLAWAYMNPHPSVAAPYGDNRDRP